MLVAVKVIELRHVASSSINAMSWPASKLMCEYRPRYSACHAHQAASVRYVKTVKLDGVALYGGRGRGHAESSINEANA